MSPFRGGRSQAVILDKGYQGVETPNTQISGSGLRCLVAKMLWKMSKRRLVVEPTIGHTMMDGKPGRSPLRESLLGVLDAVPCGEGHIRWFFKRIGFPFTQIWQQLTDAFFVTLKFV
jgi:hypothetical protein